VVLPHDIHERIRLARRVLEGDTCPVKCGEPLDIAPGYATDEYDMTPLEKKQTMNCQGNGRVEFCGFGRVLMGRKEEDTMVLPFIDWLVSGLCAACQETKVRTV